MRVAATGVEVGLDENSDTVFVSFSDEGGHYFSVSRSWDEEIAEDGPAGILFEVNDQLYSFRGDDVSSLSISPRRIRVQLKRSMSKRVDDREVLVDGDFSRAAVRLTEFLLAEGHIPFDREKP